MNVSGSKIAFSLNMKGCKANHIPSRNHEQSRTGKQELAEVLLDLISSIGDVVLD